MPKKIAASRKSMSKVKPITAAEILAAAQRNTAAANAAKAGNTVDALTAKLPETMALADDLIRLPLAGGQS